MSSNERKREGRDIAHHLSCACCWFIVGAQGRLVIPNTLSPPLAFLPPSLYTILLSIPPKELSRKPARRPTLTQPRFEDLSTPDKLSAKLDSALKLEQQGEGAFGGGDEEEEPTGWMGFGTDLETLKVGGQELEELDLELGLFGGLKVVDVSSMAL